MSTSEDHSAATFGGGCFWCTEAVFSRLQGVISVVPGYAGGHLAHPTYEQVCSGNTGHAEVIHITFDPNRIDYRELLEIFFASHNPTTWNRQGNDVGTQYRSVVFYHDEHQNQIAKNYIAELNASGKFSAPIVTELAPFTEFFPAEDYHRDYFRRNPSQPYCCFVIEPKLKKMEQQFRDKFDRS